MSTTCSTIGVGGGVEAFDGIQLSGLSPPTLITLPKIFKTVLNGSVTQYLLKSSFVDHADT